MLPISNTGKGLISFPGFFLQKGLENIGYYDNSLYF
jgi:hypothetical protein